jgi:P pilus assembly chaperone PapD
MTKREVPFRRSSADEQTVLRQMQVKLLVRPKDLKECDQILVGHHYLHSARLVGEQLRYAVVWKGR